MTCMKILIAGFPKSGNTWLNYLVAYGSGATYIDLDNPDRRPKSKRIIDLLYGEPSFSSKYSYVFKTHRLPGDINVRNYDSLIYLVRDPRDVIASFFFYKYYFLPKNEGVTPPFGFYEKAFVRRYVFFKHTIKTSMEWKNHINDWQEYSVLYVKYEDLRLRGENTMRKLFADLDISLNTNTAKALLSEFSFDRMAKNTDERDGKSDFYRKGIIGDYKNHFTWFDKMFVVILLRKELKILGYL